LKDGAVNNQLGKAILLLSIHRLCKAFDRVQYFPAYELFMDELRDYRFYAPDMIHPGEQGSSYLWERFSETYFSGETRTIVEEVEKLLKSLSHRPVHPGSPQWQEFIAKTQRTISELSARFPFLDFSREWAMIREQSPS
jgi:hypothetical protein